MRLGARLAWIVVVMVLLFAFVILGMMQRQLEQVRASRQPPATGPSSREPSRPWTGGVTPRPGEQGGASGPSGATGARGDRKRPDGIPEGAIW